MSTIPKSLAKWIAAAIESTPKDIKLIYFEWNTDCRGSRDVIAVYAFGYTLTDFDPEDPTSLTALSDWRWESKTSAVLASVNKWDDATLKTGILAFLRGEKTIANQLKARGRQIAFGRHESSVVVFPELTLHSAATAFYELHVSQEGNEVDVQDDVLDNDVETLDKIDSFQRFEYPLSENATFHLQPRGRELDVLFAVSWFICSDRMRGLIQEATDYCQVFPIRLYRSKKIAPEKLIPGYCVVHLYEQVGCLHPDDVLEPPYEGGLPTFDRDNGYRIVRSKVGERDIFRIAYENQRLIVSQSFRDKCERVGITGIEWLRRETMP